MRVLIIAPYFAPHAGGVESYTLNMAKQLIASGWEVVVVTSSLEGSPATETVHGIKVYRLQKAIAVSNTPIGWRWRSQLKKIYKIEKPDVINGHVPVPYLADVAERCRGRIPFVLTYHNDLAKNKPAQRLIVGVLNTTMIRRTLRRSDRIIVTSQYYVDTSKFLQKHLHKVSVVSPGVDTALFNPQVKPIALPTKYRNTRIILFVGSISKNQQHKGLDTLITAFARLHHAAGFDDTRLVIVGAGNGAAQYQGQAALLEVSDSVEFTGYIADELLAQYYKRASVFAMPSKDRSEGFGMVFMEAGAVGTPTIGTEIGGIPYAVLDNQTGLLVPPDDTKALSRALRKILRDPKLAHSLGDAGAKRAATEFDWGMLTERTAEVLTQTARLTIVQIAGYYPPHLGGMERVVQELSEELARRAYDVRVLTSNINESGGTESHNPYLHIDRLPAFEFAHTPFALGFIPALFKMPKRSVFHLHLAQGFYPEWTLFVAKLKRIPYVVHFHLDLEPSGRFALLFKAYKAVAISAVIKHADAVIVFSSEQQTFIHERYGVAKKKIIIIPNGVGEEYFIDKRPARVKQHIPSLLYVGRINSQKRVHILTEAMGLLHESAELVIIGDGEERAETEAAIPESVKPRITFTGQLSPSDTLPYFKKADAFVMASRIEGMPLAILEAMASGLPVVGADVQGIRELVRGVGIVVKNPSPKTFARNLDDLLADPKKCEKLSRKSSDTAHQYSWATLTDRFEHLYYSLSKGEDR